MKRGANGDPQAVGQQSFDYEGIHFQPATTYTVINETRTGLFAANRNLEGNIMKALFNAVAMAAVLSIPPMCYAQSNQPVTRAQVRSELVQLEKAGYDPSSDQTQYPRNIQAAEAKVSAQQQGGATYGGVANDTSSGRASAWSAKQKDIPGFPAMPDFQRP
jgi:hypothetical protein